MIPRRLFLVFCALCVAAPAVAPVRAAPDEDAARLVFFPEAGVPVLTPAPLVIPRPKRMATGNRPFRFTRETRIVLADDAAGQDKRGAELLRRALQERFGQDAPLVRAHAAPLSWGVTNAASVIVLGEPGRNAPLDRLLAQRGVAVPKQPEGYALAVLPHAVFVAGRDRKGTFWGVQTLIQLLAADRRGALVRSARITDWPTLPLRGVQLSHGNNALVFHKRLIANVLSPFKMNALFLEAGQIRWNADPAIAPPWAGRREQVVQEIVFARRRGITIYPLVRSGENPSVLAEAGDLFGAPAFHVDPDARFPGLRLLKNDGFGDVVAVPGSDPANIRNLARIAAQIGALGALQTTEAGTESKESVLDTENRGQFTAFVLAAEYFWNGGVGPAPADLPATADEIFTRRWADPDPADARVRRGFAVDLSPFAPTGSGPFSGDRRLADGVLYRFAGPLPLENSTSRRLPFYSPVGRAIVARQVNQVRFVLAAARPAPLGTKIGTIRLEMDNGGEVMLDLVYGVNIAAPDDKRALARASVVWKGSAASGGPAVLRSLIWKNPEPDLPLRTITLTATSAGLTLFAVTALQ